jgi:hypothetical protein
MKLVRPGIIVTSVALAIVAPLSASAAASSSHVQPTTGTITGTVTGAGSVPIGGACITLESSGSAFWPDAATTNAQGAYTISAVTPNQSDPYEVAVDPACSGGPNANYMPHTSADFNVLAGQTTTVNATLTLGGSITGRVFLGGVATAGVCVVANAVSDAGYAKATSAGDGTYVLSGMTPDTYTVQFEVCGNAPQPNIQPVLYGAHADGSGASVTLATGQQIALGNQTVQLGGEVDLKLTDGLGHPLTTDVFPVFLLTDTSWAGVSFGFQSDAPDVNGYWHTYGLLPKSYEIQYYYCPPDCRAGPIGYYAGQGVGGTSTPVTPIAGGAALLLTDAVVIPADSTTSSLLTFSPGTPSAGQTVTFEATITDTQTGTVPTGQVDFLYNMGSLGSAPLNSHGVATLTSNVLSQGVYQVHSSYSGDGDSEPSSSTNSTVTVSAAVTGGAGGGGGGGAAAPVVTAAPVTRVAGTDRISTAVAVSQGSFPSGNAGAVVLARADDYPDALVGGPLAAARNAPLLLTEGSALPAATAAEVARVLPAGGTVYVLGGTTAVPATVVAQLTALGYQVATALGSPTTVLLATGTNFPDALAAGPAAAHVHGAILLTDGSTVPAETATYLAGAHLTYAVGGPAAAAVPSAIAILGSDRFATAAAVAAKFFPSSAIVGVATGAGFPDALAGGAQLALMGGPLLLSSDTSVPASTMSYLTADHTTLTNVYVYGGTTVLSSTVLAQLTAAFGS